MVVTETVRPTPRLHIRGQDFGMGGADDPVEPEKIRGAQVRMFFFREDLPFRFSETARAASWLS